MLKMEISKTPAASLLIMDANLYISGIIIELASYCKWMQFAYTYVYLIFTNKTIAKTTYINRKFKYILYVHVYITLVQVHVFGKLINI